MRRFLACAQIAAQHVEWKIFLYRLRIKRFLGRPNRILQLEADFLFEGPQIAFQFLDEIVFVLDFFVKILVADLAWGSESFVWLLQGKNLVLQVSHPFYLLSYRRVDIDYLLQATSLVFEAMILGHILSILLMEMQIFLLHLA